jgi:hypothetical protein
MQHEIGKFPRLGVKGRRPTVERRLIQAAPSKNADVATAGSTNGSGAAAEITLASPLPDRLAELERRISVALADDGARAATLSNLLQQTEWALPLAEDFARSEQQTALDPLAIPDPARRGSGVRMRFLLAIGSKLCSRGCARVICRLTSTRQWGNIWPS